VHGIGEVVKKRSKDPKWTSKQLRKVCDDIKNRHEQEMVDKMAGKRLKNL